MMSPIETAAKHVERETAKLGFEGLRRHEFHELVSSRAIFDQRRDRDHLESELLLEFDELRQSLDRTIVVDELAQHAHRRKPRKCGEIDRCFGVAGPFQHAARSCSQRKYMS